MLELWNPWALLEPETKLWTDFRLSVDEYVQDLLERAGQVLNALSSARESFLDPVSPDVKDGSWMT